jgi:hypothetical protein
MAHLTLLLAVPRGLEPEAAAEVQELMADTCSIRGCYPSFGLLELGVAAAHIKGALMRLCHAMSVMSVHILVGAAAGDLASLNDASVEDLDQRLACVVAAARHAEGWPAALAVWRQIR